MAIDKNIGKAREGKTRAAAMRRKRFLHLVANGDEPVNAYRLAGYRAKTLQAAITATRRLLAEPGVTEQIAIIAQQQQTGGDVGLPDEPLSRARAILVLTAVAVSSDSQARDRITAVQTMMHLCGWRPVADTSIPVDSVSQPGGKIDAAKRAQLADAMRVIAEHRAREQNLIDPVSMEEEEGADSN